MNPTFPGPNRKWIPLLAFAGAVVLASSLFLLIPITQTFDNAKPEIALIREIRVTPPPPASPPPPPPEPKEQPNESLPPELVQPPDALALDQLDITLAPGTGDALAIGLADPSLVAEHDVVSEIQEIFTFEDLAQAPRAVYLPRFDFPRALIRKGINSGTLVIQVLIDENGKTTVEKIISSTQPDLTEPAKRLAARARFSIPKIEGKAVKVRGQWPLTLKAPNIR